MMSGRHTWGVPPAGNWQNTSSAFGWSLRGLATGEGKKSIGEVEGQRGGWQKGGANQNDRKTEMYVE